MPRDSTHMETFSPEFAQHWLAEHRSVADARGRDEGDDAVSVSQQFALEELAERVSAARSVY